MIYLVLLMVVYTLMDRGSIELDCLHDKVARACCEARTTPGAAMCSKARLKSFRPNGPRSSKGEHTKARQRGLDKSLSRQTYLGTGILCSDRCMSESLGGAAVFLKQPKPSETTSVCAVLHLCSRVKVDQDA